MKLIASVPNASFFAGAEWDKGEVIQAVQRWMIAKKILMEIWYDHFDNLMGVKPPQESIEAYRGHVEDLFTFLADELGMGLPTLTFTTGNTLGIGTGVIMNFGMQEGYRPEARVHDFEEVKAILAGRARAEKVVVISGWTERDVVVTGAMPGVLVEFFETPVDDARAIGVQLADALNQPGFYLQTGSIVEEWRRDVSN